MRPDRDRSVAFPMTGLAGQGLLPSDVITVTEEARVLIPVDPGKGNEWGLRDHLERALPSLPIDVALTTGRPRSQIISRGLSHVQRTIVVNAIVVIPSDRNFDWRRERICRIYRQ